MSQTVGKPTTETPSADYLQLEQELMQVKAQRNSLAHALSKLHRTCQLALAGPDGRQHVYFATHHSNPSFVKGTDAMLAAEEALAGVAETGSPQT